MQVKLMFMVVAKWESRGSYEVNMSRETTINRPLDYCGPDPKQKQNHAMQRVRWVVKNKEGFGRPPVSLTTQTQNAALFDAKDLNALRPRRKSLNRKK